MSFLAGGGGGGGGGCGQRLVLATAQRTLVLLSVAPAGGHLLVHHTLDRQLGRFAPADSMVRRVFFLFFFRCETVSGCFVRV